MTVNLADKFRQISWLLVPVSIVLIDVFVRWDGEIPPSAWSNPESILISIALSCIFWWAISHLIGSSKRPVIWAAALSFPAAFSLCAAWRYHLVTDSDVSVGIMLYTWGEPGNASGFAAQGISPLFVLATLALSALWTATLSITRAELSQFSRRLCLAMPAVWIMAALVLPPGIPAYGSPYASDVHLSQVIGEATRRIAIGDVDTVLSVANRLPIPPAQPAKRPNILVIIGESVRYDRIGALGYERDTTPYMTQFFKDNPDDVFRFDRAYTPSPYSPIAMATALTGLYPSRKKQEMHQAPVLWQYARAYDAHGFFITPQDWNIAGLSDFFLVNGAPKTTITAKDFSAPVVNDTGIHDQIAADRTRTLIQDELQKDELFLGVLKLNATHFPFLTSDNVSWPIENIRDRYDGAVLLTDDVFGTIIDSLKETGRLDNTIIIYTADHSEFFYNLDGVDLKNDRKIADLWRDGLRAQSCHPAVARVPMWIYVPPTWQNQLNIDPEAMRRNQLRTASNLDIVPTVLDALSLQNYAHQSGFPALDGRSLLREIPPEHTTACFTSASWVRWMPVGVALFGPDHAVYSRDDFPQMMTFDLHNPAVFNESIAAIPSTTAALDWAKTAGLENPQARRYFEALGNYNRALWPVGFSSSGK